MTFGTLNTSGSSNGMILLVKWVCENSKIENLFKLLVKVLDD
jgi:hypothetical protein